MNNVASFRNSGALEQCFGSRGVLATAGGSGDATLVTGNTINRFTENGGTIMSGAFKVSGNTTLASTETLGLTIGYQTSANGSDWDTAVYGIGCGATASDYQTIATGVLTASSVKRFCVIDLSPLKQYIRIVFTPQLSASGTDTALLVGEFVTSFNTVEDYDNA
jgi:hypothetical protein